MWLGGVILWNPLSGVYMCELSTGIAVAKKIGAQFGSPRNKGHNVWGSISGLLIHGHSQMALRVQVG